MLDRTTSLCGIEQGLDCPEPASREHETPYEEHRRLVREWTEHLSNLPGWQGRICRIALASGWW